jgi:hypothetical protein
MKLFKTNLTGISTGVYGNISMRFSMGGKPAKDKTIPRLFPFQGCREEFTKNLRVIVGSAKKEAVDQHRTRVLFYSRVSLGPNTYPPVNIDNLDKAGRTRVEKYRAAGHKKLMNSLLLIHHFEEKHGWLKTKYYPVYNNNDASLFVYMAVGSPRWQKTPHYLSLYTLLIRSGVNGFAPRDDSAKAIKDEIIRQSNQNAAGHLQSMLKQYDKVNLLLAEQDKIIESKDLSIMYPQRRYLGNNGFNEGIAQLLYGRSYDYIMSNSLQKRCDQNKIPHSIQNSSVQRKLKLLKKKETKNNAGS